MAPCPQCRTEVPAGAAFCPACGQRVGTGTLTATGTAPGAPALGVPLTGAPAPAAPAPDDATRVGAGTPLPAPTAPATGAASDPARTLPPPTRVAAPASGTPPPQAQGAGAVLTPGAAFGPRYRILRLLGAGGMGIVYQAWDEELGIAVALKLIRPEILADPVSGPEMERRFKRELLLARQVTHRQVVRIHDLGEIDGVKYFTMPFIEGRNLATVIAEEGRLPVNRTLRIARQVVAGLAAAHEVGVVHRDLKPENVMLDAGDSAVIMDFGIARSQEGTSATQQGAVIGTIAYMAPEQARGESVDHRTDQYAFGLLLYDMLSGHRRFGSHQSAMAEMIARMHEAPPRLRTVEPRVPEGLDALVARCLEPDPDRRYASTADLIAALDALDAEGHAPAVPAATTALGTPSGPVVPAPAARRPWAPLAGIALVLALGAGGGAWWMLNQRSTGAPAATAPREPISVLVADFANATGDPVFDGSVEQAIGLGIEGASFIVAYPRRDAQRAARRIKPDAPLDEEMARLVAQREGVKTVLAGRVARAGSGYEVSVRVVDPVPGTELARATETAPDKAAVLDAAGRLAAKVRTALGDVTPESAMAGARETFTAASLEAARDYAEAQALANANKDKEAIDLYRRAIERDPDLGRAYSGWAASAFKLGRRDEAEQLYQKALALVDRMTEREKYRTLGAYYLNVAGNYEKAIENFQALVQKYPADGAGHNNLAIAYFGTLDFPRALEEGKRVLDVYPKSVLYRSNYSLYAMYAGDFATAAAEGREVAKTRDFLAYLPIAMAALADGKPADALAAYEEARATGALGESLAAIGTADVAMYEGRYADAVARLEAGIAADLQEDNPAGAAAKEVARAEALVALGRAPDALKALARARELGTDAAVVVPAARLLTQLGRAPEAEAIAAALENDLSPRSRAFALLVRAQAALARGRAAEAVRLANEARKQVDLWLVRYWLGVAYVEAGAYAEALPELERSLARRGEATAVFLDDVPTYRSLPPVHYWLGRAHEGLGARDAARRAYETYLAIRPETTGDPLSRDAARRLAAAP
jgi:tetratricopeptide (TPR) repeat protein